MPRLSRRIVLAALLATGSAAAVFVLAYQFDPERMVQEVATAYVKLRIEERDLQQVALRTEDGMKWQLLFTVVAKDKQAHCDQVQISKRLQRIGDPSAFASDEYPSKEMLEQPNVPSLIRSQIWLPRPMPPGAYVLTLQNTCYEVNPDRTLRQLLLPAVATICFSVDAGDPRDDTIPALAEQCIDDLSSLSIGTPDVMIGMRGR